MSEEAVIVEKVDAVVHREHPGQFTLKLKSGWRALPVPGSMHFSADDIKKLTPAFESLGASTLYAVALEMRGDIDTILQFTATEAGLKAFSRACSHFNYALTTPDCEALVVCATDDYFVVCGPEPFVRLAVGQTFEEAMKEFHDYVVIPEWGARTRRSFESVWRAFLNPGPVIVFPGWMPTGTS